MAIAKTKSKATATRPVRLRLSSLHVLSYLSFAGYVKLQGKKSSKTEIQEYLITQ